MNSHVLAPGARVLIRDAEWLVRKVNRTATNRKAVSVIGLSKIVKDREAIFLEEIDQLESLNPVDTEFVVDTSSFYRDSLLFMERRKYAGKQVEIGELETLIFTRPKVGYMLNVEKRCVCIL